MSYPKSSAGGNLSTAAMGHCHTLTAMSGIVAEISIKVISRIIRL
jgi:hypothetical protein